MRNSKKHDIEKIQVKSKKVHIEREMTVLEFNIESIQYLIELL